MSNTEEGKNQTKLESYCSIVQEYMDKNIHIGIWIAIGILFLLSLLELVLELCGDFMPYHQIFKPISKQEEEASLKIQMFLEINKFKLNIMQSFI